MKKYNYFDDDCEQVQTQEKLKSIINTVVKFVNSFIYGDGFNKLKAKFKDKRISLKSILIAIFVLILICFIIIFSHSIHSQNKKNEQFCEDAGNVCINYIADYGSIKWELLDETEYGENQARLLGLCYVRQMDFDNDGTSELMLCYNDNNVYHLEVWGYSGKDFVQFYSQEANSTEDATDGVWIGFYRKNNKSYICQSDKSNPQQVNLYALKGDTFKKKGTCEYDVENDVYSIKGKTNTTDFETIKLSVFRKSKADIIVDLVTENIDSFGNISSVAMTQQKSDAQLKAAAYYEIIQKRIEKYGSPTVKTDEDYSYIDGVAIAKLIDFDGDGNEELFLVYRKYKSESKYDSYSGDYVYYDVPMYAMDVYSWNGSTANRIFSKDSISGCLNDENENVNFVILKNGTKTTNICNNVYTFDNSYNYTCTSKIYRLKNEKFETLFSAKYINNYGYKTYYIDNEKVYSSTFDEQGYQVPFFLNDDDTYDSTKYNVIYVSGKEEEKFQSIVNNTIEVIESLNSN